MNTDQIAEKAASFFEWPDPQRKDHVTLASCVIFANFIAEMAVAKERERCAKVAESHTTHQDDPDNDVWQSAYNHVATEISAAIRGKA